MGTARGKERCLCLEAVSGLFKILSGIHRARTIQLYTRDLARALDARTAPYNARTAPYTCGRGFR